MPYVVVSSGSLSGLGDSGHDGTGLTSDGTTHGDRAMMLVALNVQVQDWRAQCQKALDGTLSVSGVFARGLLFVPSAYQNRQAMLKARDDLDAFMTDISARMRDPAQSTAAVMEFGVGMLQQIGGQIGATLTSEAKNTLRAFATVVKKETVNNANALLSAARDAGQGATQGVFPVWVAPAAGLFLVAYMWNTFRSR